ncbi:EamA family transporter [Jannaschia aquimarina]|uniref:EamA-like transporter family protein n=1 Tax=Jannaschia aquimarina TaxID=935700 RepID=A0A0D1EF61_9RHOB|nr:EamA family transporter [Jannaschia aquimarina]KIT14550.1 EamA-like transporter family protein [Jannaschia aquimarina]SNT35338.1 EamA-like transporter family protein [Jannaschia aquimarina]
METWVAITIGAAFLQNVRSTLQKHLKGRMGTTGATFVRFGYGVPFAAIYAAILFTATGGSVPDVPAAFLPWLALGAVTQIGGTFLLVHLFSFRNFTVGNAYSRTETAQTAIFTFLLFGVGFSWTAIASILISVAGVMAISVARTAVTPRALITSLVTPVALMGMGAGTLFGLASVGYQTAARSVQAESFLAQAVVTLLAAITLQTVLMLGWMIARNRAELVRVGQAWRPGLAVGFVGATATFGWFAAFTLQQAALVKVVAQIEMLFAFASSVFFFRESINRLEVVGCALIVIGVIVLLLGGG